MDQDGLLKGVWLRDDLEKHCCCNAYCSVLFPPSQLPTYGRLPLAEVVAGQEYHLERFFILILPISCFAFSS